MSVRYSQLALIVFVSLLMLPAMCLAGPDAPSASKLAQAPVTLNDLWQGKAHFQEVTELQWQPGDNAVHEGAGSFFVYKGVWYVLNRAALPHPSDNCTPDNTRTVIRASTDQGRTWSAPTTLVDPGTSAKGDHCAVLDGSLYHDVKSSTWHMLAQCLDGKGALWALCHYTRRATTPLGRFEADPENPVVVGGELWSRICQGHGKKCPPTTRDEGTPDIIGKTDDQYIVTMHGYDPSSKTGYRGVVHTPDFHTWHVSGNGLPDDAILGPTDCETWLSGCVGTGEASTISYSRDPHRYMIAETMTMGLECTAGQQWVFQLLRSASPTWPTSGTGRWEKLPGKALLRTKYPSPVAACPVQYARLIKDGVDTFLIYEDWDRATETVHRRLLHLVSGRAPPER
ncbi:hypothetical protein [Novosphingobium sp. YAF33]|uniref:hypothetical protein n=1 Tax=Novosphingobium sp. YAF33 TaxID=3233082 RepID=UPI003F98DE40